MSTTTSTIVSTASIIATVVVGMFWQRIMILRALRQPRTWRNLLIGPKS